MKEVAFWILDDQQYLVYTTVYLPRRFDSAYVDLRDRARRGECGTVQRLSLVSRNNPGTSYSYLKTSGES